MPNLTFLTGWSPQLLSVLRIATGLLFLHHGTAQLLGFPTVEYFAELDTMTAVSGVFELVGGLLIVLGLFTRPVAFILSGMMAVAYFLVHAGQSFFPIVNQGELAILLCFVFLYLAAAGPGPWSVDAMMGKEAKHRQPAMP